ncbi:MAG: RNA polymerase factor sigma-54 [Eubacterium sp.]|nr:RNA polymerase factor sigma-54 [Eubacterium sp.]
MKILNEIKIDQRQKLVMTPGMLQSLNILRFTTGELNELIKKELMDNPALEQYADEYMNKSMSVTQKDVNLEEDNYEKYVSQGETLQDYLRLQLTVAVKSKRDREVGEFIIESLDDNGYMTFSVKEIAEKMSVDLENVQEILKIVQTFDPPGVAAVDVRDCLLRQLKTEGDIESLAKKILLNHIEDVAGNRLSAIAEKLDAQLEEVQQAVDLIKSLNPHPGSTYESGRTVEYIVPDIFVTEDENGILIVEDNRKSTPTLMVSSYYKRIYQEAEDKDEIKEYLHQKLESAAALIRSIEQRRNTILKISEQIVDFQQEFFKKGEKHLKPMKLNDVAEALDIHQSTVSRTVNGKYLQCSRGIFELKYFFTSKICGQMSGDVSSGSIKAYIKEIIAGENSNKPYSDEKILDILKEKGFKLSRRTVAKYRDEMGIPSSSKRKRY